DDAMLETWQADANGKYNHPDDLQPKALDADWFGFGRIATDDNGACTLETIKPGRVGYNTLQAPHLLIAVYARGMLKQLYTRIYFAGETAHDGDPILPLVPPDSRDSLMAQPDSARPGHLR